MWPWLLILAGTLLIIGALVARHRMMSDYHARLAEAEPTEARRSTVERDDPATTEPLKEAAPRRTVEPAAPEPVPESPAAPVRVAPPAFARPAAAAPTITTRREAKAARAAGLPVGPKPEPLFADLPVGHRLTSPPTVRVRAQDVPLQDWLRYYADGNAWSGVIQSVSDRVSGDPVLRPYFGWMDRATLQRHVMSTVMMLTGEGVTVGAVRRLADAHLSFVQSGGEPVTEAVWNRMAATLGNALREHSAPEGAILSLNTTVAPLRAVIVSRDGA